MKARIEVNEEVIKEALHRMFVSSTGKANVRLTTTDNIDERSGARHGATISGTVEIEVDAVVH